MGGRKQEGGLTPREAPFGDAQGKQGKKPPLHGEGNSKRPWRRYCFEMWSWKIR